MYKPLVIFAVLVLATSCKRKPFVNSKLKFEKLAGNCNVVDPDFGMESNINGERYVFQYCLPDDFNEKQMTVSRQHDTVVVNFNKMAANSATFKLTLDIDSYPSYSFITIGEDTYIITPTKD
jgi:hypothetical protein